MSTRLDDLGAISKEIKVFRDSPVWDTHDKWWMVPVHVLKELYVISYLPDLDQFYDPIDPAGCVREIREAHPGCVLVY